MGKGEWGLRKCAGWAWGGGEVGGGAGGWVSPANHMGRKLQATAVHHHTAQG